MTYSYRCSIGHRFEENFRIGEAPNAVCCRACDHQATRDFGADFSGVTFGVVDPFRSFDLSVKKSRAEGEQQRHLDAPRDNFERKTLERTLGRTYIGNDTSGMSKHARAGIEAYQSKKLAGELA